MIVVNPNKKRGKGLMKVPEDTVWYGYKDQRRKTKVFMNQEKAQEWMREGKPVFMTGKVGQLR